MEVGLQRLRGIRRVYVCRGEQDDRCRHDDDDGDEDGDGDDIDDDDGNGEFTNAEVNNDHHQKCVLPKKAFSSLTPGFPAIFDNLHFEKIQIAFLFHPGNSTGRPGKDEGPRLYHHLLKGKSHTGLPPEQTHITC